MVCISQRFVPYPVSFSKPPGTLQCKPRFYNHTRYDAWNRLVEAKDGQTVIARYEYDGVNRRIKSHIDSGAPSNPTGIDTYVHCYYNSAWQILETLQSDTPSAQPETLQPKHQFVWSQRYIDAAVLRDENAGANGLCDDDRLYYVNDANFNVTALLDTAGDALERYVYSPYGVATIYDATWTNTRSTSSYANVTLYTGRELDPETGLYSYRNRYYSAELGRFVSRDRIGDEGGDVNLYCYVGNRPIGSVDPLGFDGCSGSCIFSNGRCRNIDGHGKACFCSGGRENCGCKKCRLIGKGMCNRKTCLKRCTYSCDGGGAEDHPIPCGPGNWDPPCPGWDE